MTAVYVYRYVCTILHVFPPPPPPRGGGGHSHLERVGVCGPKI